MRPGIGYVRLSAFNEETDTELAAALKQIDVGNLEGLVLDLRGNPGGLLNEAVAVSDMFLDKNQLIVSHHGRASQERRYYAVRGNRGIQVPVVVLVNGGSASASEIVTGSIQDHDRGLVVGEQTFGKGLVQTVSPLSENTGLALTTARYYTPSGRLIQRDYKDVSLYDYLYNHKNPQPTEVKLTDGGRQVFGGGGITPDVMVSEPKPNAFQELLLRRDVFFPSQGGVGSFTTYFLGTKPDVTKDFVADDNVMALFRQHLDKEKIPYTDADIAANLDWIKREIKKEVFISVFGLHGGRSGRTGRRSAGGARPSSRFRRRARSTKTCARSWRSAPQARRPTLSSSGSKLSKSQSQKAGLPEAGLFCDSKRAIARAALATEPAFVTINAAYLPPVGG